MSTNEGNDVCYAPRLQFYFQDVYSTNEDAVKFLVGNKIDKAAEREVSKAEALDFARQHNMLFLETSAKTQTGIQQAFYELCQKV